MFRIRDHIISLVAVFFSLGLGILIGTGMSDDMLVTQQRLLIEQMTKDYRTLREERMEMEARIQSLTKDLYLWESYQEALYPGIVKGALADSNLSLIRYGADIPPGVLTTLQDAQANICSVISVEPASDSKLAKTGLGPAVAKLASGLNPDQDEQDILDSYLADNSVRIELHGRKRVGNVVIILGERAGLDAAFVREIIDELDPNSVSVVALEWTDVSDSLLGSLKEAGISTIDNADSVFGQFSLLSVLRGSAGNYGIKDAADQFIATF
ncbi:MAG: copper transporter [Bacillota bacterium]|nr:copper transporter [Bacillota bacterium]MDW7684057.1 copper transporter [Bacillota bacterium]